MGQPRDIVEISWADDIELASVGKKAFELGELKYLGIPIPRGFVIKTSFFEKFLETTKISKDLNKTKKIYHPSLSDSKDKLFRPVIEKILYTHFPQNLASEFHGFFRNLAGELTQSSVNIFSSSLTDESMFFSDVLGDANTVLIIKEIWTANLDSPAAIVIQENLKYSIEGKISTNNPVVDEALTPDQKEKLLQYLKIIQDRFYLPKDVEFGVINGQVFITKLNPHTGTARDHIKKISLNGISVNPGIATGPARILNSHSVNAIIKNGEILIVSGLDASLYNKIKGIKALAVDSVFNSIKEKAIYRRNFRIPTIEGVKNAVNLFKNGNVVTVNGTTGEIYSGGLTR
jgi:phosphoenolpyruvate synthase/pyruvate phosphate dikinase